jgi:hypothetical protein
MKKILVCSLIIALLSGCSFTFEFMTPHPTWTPAPSETSTSAPPTATEPPPTQTPIPGFTPTGSNPVFYGAYMALEQGALPGQTRFAAGTRQIFAIWNYQNMRPGLTVKREWYLNGQLWLMREESWNFAKYGERGTDTDISIYDFEVGLPAGVYQLMMYIDGVRQPIGRTTEAGTDTFIEFEILPPIEARSPNGGWTVRADLGRLILFDTGGGQAEIFAGREIAAVAWFPDSGHLLVVDRDRSEQIRGLSVGIRDDLWIINISSLETHLLYEGDTALGGQVGLTVSPDGKYIASSEGSGFGDACFVDVRMLFFEVVDDFQRVKAIEQEQFSGLPEIPDGVVYPTDAGRWEANARFAVPLGVTCAPDESLNGTYVFDVDGLTVTRK